MYRRSIYKISGKRLKGFLVIISREFERVIFVWHLEEICLLLRDIGRILSFELY